jgi:hypothetical protein
MTYLSYLRFTSELLSNYKLLSILVLFNVIFSAFLHCSWKYLWITKHFRAFLWEPYPATGKSCQGWAAFAIRQQPGTPWHHLQSSSTTTGLVHFGSRRPTLLKQISRKPMFETLLERMTSRSCVLWQGQHSWLSTLQVPEWFLPVHDTLALPDTCKG